MEDSDLISRLKSRDKNAFNELITLYSSQVLNTCFRFLLNKEDAEDISQEVFIEIYQSIKFFKGHSKLSTWIYRIAVAKSLDEIKKRNRKKRISSFGKILHLDEVAYWIGGGTRPDEVLNKKETMKEIKDALNSLPDSQRIAYSMSKIDGFSNQEIAEIMDITTLAVESLLYRAGKKIKHKLEFILK